MKSSIENNTLILYPEGRIDSGNAEKVQEEILSEIEKHPGMNFILDADGLEYISSAGLRILLILAKQSAEKLVMRNVSRDIFEVLEITGFDTILDVRKKPREISLEGCEVIGQGALGTVYKMDEDTIVKVFRSPDSLPVIEKETRLARLAFLHGIPTAIAYDIVKAGDNYGAVFEMVKAENCGDLIASHPERKEEIVRSYADLIRKIHAVEIDPGILPDARTIFLDYLTELRDVLPEDITAKVRELLEAMPEDLHVVHGDVQMKNVMMSDGNPIVIDMETLSTGNPVFDLQAIYDTYHLFKEDDPGESMDFFGITGELSDYIWEYTFRHYLNEPDEETFQKVVKKTAVLASVRFMYQIFIMKISKPELADIRREHTISHLRELLKEVNSLVI